MQKRKELEKQASDNKAEAFSLEKSKVFTSKPK